MNPISLKKAFTYKSNVCPQGALLPPRVLGHPLDSRSWQSGAVPKNGFNPTWGEEVSFTLHHPQLAMVEFKVGSRQSNQQSLLGLQVKSRVKSVGGRDEHLGSCCVALPLVRKGFRNITLQVNLFIYQAREFSF